jgi:REP element-mobilizing transposase RayT/ActR/RegA family two-component response regulator
VHDKILNEMTLSLLVITSQPSFGEHIRQSLEETRPAHVEIVDNRAAAIYKLEGQEFSHVFLDTDLKNDSILDLGLALRATDSNLRLVIIAANQTAPRLDALRPWTFLRKPFFIPDLLRILTEDERPALSLPYAENEKVLNQAESAAKEKETLAWMRDVSKAAQHLTRLTLESSAQAALIIRHGEMWAYAGQLSEEASAELVQIVGRDKKMGDLLKFLRLDTTQAEHMLFSTELADETNLAMIFDAETPFSAIRRQATHLADSLAFSLEEKTSSEIKPPLEESDNKDLIDLFDFEDGGDNALPPISEILENIPNPTPTSASANIKTSAPTSTPSPPKPSLASLANEPMPNPFAKAKTSRQNEPSVNSLQERSPAIQASDFFEKKQEQVDFNQTRVQVAQPRQSIDIDLDATRISKSARPETPIRKPSPEELIETRPRSITEVAGRIILEPSPSGTYDLTYACLLVPRFSTHHLTGDIAERLSEWMPNICVAFGWRLEHLSVRPDYLQWVIHVPPTASPGYLMRIMRKQTSEKIFGDFPRQKKENPSGDFWAPGYLIMGGSQPHPSKLVKDYIKHTRERQGA